MSSVNCEGQNSLEFGKLKSSNITDQIPTPKENPQIPKEGAHWGQ